MPSRELRRTSPLHDRHVAAGAKLADFSGWSMPIEYAGGGVLAEHAAVRERRRAVRRLAPGHGTVRGPGAAAFVDRCLTNDLGRIGPGQAQYTLCCLPDGDAQAGGVVDDLIVYLHGPDDVLLVPNAANAAEVLGRLADEAPDGRHGHRPARRGRRPGRAGAPVAAGARAARRCPGELAYMSFVTGTGARGGAEVTVCRTGYTGEHGYELLVDADRAARAVGRASWTPARTSASGRAGSAPATPCAPRWATRCTATSCRATSRPVQARGRVGGRLEEAGRSGAARRCSPRRRPARAACCGACVPTGRGIPRPGMAVLDAAGAAVGEVTSGTFSPTLRTGIALALLDTASGVAEGDEVAVDVRGRPQAVEVVRPPFVESHVR